MRILITGATGLIGSEIVRRAHERKLWVNYLTTSKSKISNENGYTGFHWDPENGEIDLNSLEGVGTIIHLAGTNIFKRWTERNKRKMRESRIGGAKLLFQALQDRENEVGQFISASGISVYPSSRKKMYYEKEEDLDDSFLGNLVRDWEAAADRFSSLGLRVAKIRTGLVLANEGGALPQMQQPVKYGMGASLGSGKQWQSWIHIEDLARMYLFLVRNGLEGVFNGVAPDPVSNEELTEEIARIEGKKLRLPNVPGFALKLVMGDRAKLALDSQLVASNKIQEAGFEFNYVSLKKALKDLSKAADS